MSFEELIERISPKLKGIVYKIHRLLLPSLKKTCIKRLFYSFGLIIKMANYQIRQTVMFYKAAIFI